MELRLSPAARQDLASIWSYTTKTWSMDQADKYVSALYRDMERLKDFPNIGSRYVSDVGNFRKYPSGHHFIFYYIEVNSIHVVRILHERMDVDSQFNKPAL
jgi:toxin ParE1/3/4